MNGCQTRHITSSRNKVCINQLVCLYKAMAATMPAPGRESPAVSESLSYSHPPNVISSHVTDPLTGEMHNLKVINPDATDRDVAAFLGFGSGPHTDSGRSYIEAGLAIEPRLKDYRILVPDTFKYIADGRLNSRIGSLLRAFNADGYNLQATAGGSHGGMLAVLMAAHSAQQGQPVKNLITVGTPGFGGQLLHQIVGARTEFMRGMRDYLSSSLADRGNRESGRDQSGSPPDFVKPRNLRVTAQQLGRMLRLNLSQFPYHVAQETHSTFVVGTEDGFASLAHHQALVSMINQRYPGNAVLKPLEGQTHMGSLRRSDLAGHIADVLMPDSLNPAKL